MNRKYIFALNRDKDPLTGFHMTTSGVSADCSDKQAQEIGELFVSLLSLASSEESDKKIINSRSLHNSRDIPWELHYLGEANETNSRTFHWNGNSFMDHTITPEHSGLNGQYLDSKRLEELLSLDLSKSIRGNPTSLRIWNTIRDNNNLVCIFTVTEGIEKSFDRLSIGKFILSHFFKKDTILPIDITSDDKVLSIESLFNGEGTFVIDFKNGNFINQRVETVFHIEEWNT